MEVKFGEGKTEYGTGISITLNSNDVANAIIKYVESKGYKINGARTVKVRAHNNSGEAEIYVDPSGSVTMDGRGDQNDK